ncbi:hypothetical protein DFH08DRAFT_808007 [Mycena albidolilacea]|uniref:Uncharacterized protein n=1 Tax=Mycena albidolilacea TaxID=1033008 RepID=A0AAD7A2I0_9AGAR|nr:hypothetical protein DFH08DRAFT_808007 [Mycena albidolilacea]
MSKADLKMSELKPSLDGAPKNKPNVKASAKYREPVRGGECNGRAVETVEYGRPVPSNVIREPPLPYRLRTVHWTAVFGTIRSPGRTVTIPKTHPHLKRFSFTCSALHNDSDFLE